MSNRINDIQIILERVDETLETAKLGLRDLLDPQRTRRMSGMRNLIVFGRSVTFVLQNLRSVVNDDFDKWYAPHQDQLKADPLMRYFVEARNELEKQGKLSITNRAHVHFISHEEIRKLRPPLIGAKAFFISDHLGGSGWEIELADGTMEKYYIDLPTSIGEVSQHFSNLPSAMTPELKGATVEELAERYINRLVSLVAAARSHFLPESSPPLQTKSFPPYLRRVK